MQKTRHTKRYIWKASISRQFDYYYVPTIFYGEEKLYEAQPGQSFEEIREHIRKAFDRILED